MITFPLQNIPSGFWLLERDRGKRTLSQSVANTANILSPSLLISCKHCSCPEITVVVFLLYQLMICLYSIKMKAPWRQVLSLVCSPSEPLTPQEFREWESHHICWANEWTFSSNPSEAGMLEASEKKWIEVTGGNLIHLYLLGMSISWLMLCPSPGLCYCHSKRLQYAS